MWKVKFFAIIKSLIFLSIFLIVGYRFFVIKNLSCKLNEPGKEVEICQQFKYLINKPLFFDNLDKELLGQEVIIEDNNDQSYSVVKTTKKLPRTLEIYLQKQEPVYRLEDYQANISLVSQQGHLLTNQVEKTFPLVKLELNQELNQENHDYILELIKALENNNLKFSSLVIKEHDQLELKLESGPVIFFENTQDPEQVAWKISTILSEKKVKDIEEPIKEIDLRLNLPVIRLSSTSPGKLGIFNKHG